MHYFRFFLRSIQIVAVFGILFIGIIYFYNRNKIQSLTKNASMIALKTNYNKTKNNKKTQEAQDVQDTIQQDIQDVTQNVQGPASNQQDVQDTIQQDIQDTTQDVQGLVSNQHSKISNEQQDTQNQIEQMHNQQVQTKQIQTKQIQIKKEQIQHAQMQNEKTQNEQLKTQQEQIQFYSDAKQLSIPAPNFSLIDQNDQVFNFYDIKDKFKLVYFGFSFCPKICPDVLNLLTDAVKDLERYNKPTQIIFISIDPKRDSPSVLKSFLQYFDSNIIGLTGNKQQIELITKNFGAAYFEDKDEASGGFNHTSFIYAISPDNTYVSIFSRNDTKANIIKQILNYKTSN